METVIRVLLNLLVHKTKLDKSIWDEILSVVDSEQNEDLLHPIFKEVLLSGRLDLVHLFCARGLNPFNRPGLSTAPAIFALATERAAKLGIQYKDIFGAITSGREEHYMRALAGLKELDFSHNSEYHDYYVWDDTGILLTRAITENPAFAHFIIDNSNPHAATAHGWTGLHAGIEVNDEEIIKKLVFAGVDPSKTGRRYIKVGEDEHLGGNLTSRRINENFQAETWWDGLSSYDLSGMVKKSNEEFLIKCRKEYHGFIPSESDAPSTGAGKASSERVGETQV